MARAQRQDGPEKDVHRVAAIYGGHGTGKSNLLKGLDYMRAAVRNSHKMWPPDGPIPREPYLLAFQPGKQPSFFEAELMINGQYFRYAFTLNDHEILEETLDVFIQGKRQVLLRREEQHFTFGHKLAGDNRAAKRLTRPNSLLLSAAAATKHPMLLPVYRAFAKQILYVPWNRLTGQRMAAGACQNESLRPLIEHLLREADPGIAGLRVRQEDVLRPLFESKDVRTNSALGEIIGPLQKLLAAARDEAPDNAELFEKRPVLSLSHKGSADEDVALERADESDGIMAFLGLVVPALQAIRTGGTLCVDEIGAGIHPLQALRVVRLFTSPKLAGRGAQIIFTTMDSNILTAARLRRDQIWFAEKDSMGGSHLYPLTGFTPEKTANLKQGYVQGLYGPVPFMGWASFVAKLDAAEGP